MSKKIKFISLTLVICLLVSMMIPVKQVQAAAQYNKRSITLTLDKNHKERYIKYALKEDGTGSISVKFLNISGKPTRKKILRLAYIEYLTKDKTILG